MRGWKGMEEARTKPCVWLSFDVEKSTFVAKALIGYLPCLDKSKTFVICDHNIAEEHHEGGGNLKTRKHALKSQQCHAILLIG